jgi:hypothetical protein
MAIHPLRSTGLQSLNLTNTTAGTYTSDAISIPMGASVIMTQAAFVRGGGGTTCDVFIQTSVDNGTSWIDVMQFAFATTTVTKISGVRPYIALAANVTPSDGGLSDNTILDGCLGDRLRVKTVVVGTYSSTSTLDVDICIN